MSDYPEHDKMQAAQPAAQVVGDFLEWLTGERGLALAVYDGRGRLGPIGTNFETLMYEYFGIDRDRIESEKRQVLELARAQNAAAGMIR